MKCVLSLWAVLMAAAAGAAEGEARVKFLEGWRDRFAHSEVSASDAVPPECDFERAKGENRWFFVLPYDADHRVRFLDGTIKNGKFTKGVLHTFGFKEEKITAQRFNKLRQEFALVGRRAGGVKTVKKDGKTLPPKLVVYPPLTRPLTYKAPAHPDGMNFDPCGYALGCLRGGLNSVGADVSKFGYTVTLVNPDGLKVVVGVGMDGKGIAQKDAVAAVRKAIETKWPQRTGCVSDTDVVEFYAKSTVCLIGIKQ